MKYSPTRLAEYEFMKHVLLEGTILDVGGGRKADYVRTLRVRGTVLSININTDLDPTHVGDIMKKLPFKPKTFDAAISLNVFEHIRDIEAALANVSVTLKPGARLYQATPFIYKVHGSPDDYYRYTDSALAFLYKRAGFSQIQCYPLGEGMFHACASLIFGPLPKILRPFVMTFAAAMDKFFCAVIPRYKKVCGPSAYPVGYMAIATK
ncbi:MAG TPA: methyltransferase domain-containing protein [Acidobacteriota bacterium]|nr:methyltransferase domain-containing protein [Acidobacteriota bacterium]